MPSHLSRESPSACGQYAGPQGRSRVIAVTQTEEFRLQGGKRGLPGGWSGPPGL